MNIKTVGLIAALALVTTGAQANSYNDDYGSGYTPPSYNDDYGSGYTPPKMKKRCKVLKPKKHGYKAKKRYHKPYGHIVRKYARKHVKRCDRYWR